MQPAEGVWFSILLIAGVTILSLRFVLRFGEDLLPTRYTPPFFMCFLEPSPLRFPYRTHRGRGCALNFRLFDAIFCTH